MIVVHFYYNDCRLPVFLSKLSWFVSLLSAAIVGDLLLLLLIMLALRCQRHCFYD